MFERIQVEADDSILGLIEKFRQDANPAKVDLGVGVYRDAQGNTPIMRAVKLAEEQLLRTEMTKTYTDSHGDAEFCRHVAQLILGADSTALAAGRVSTTQTPGGSAALRVAADLLAREFPEKTLWLPAPTWPNHHDIFAATGVRLASYPYLDAMDAPDFTAMAAELRRIPAGDAVLLHACCHNPSGYDLSAAQWQEVLEIIRERELLPLIDFAYQGLGDGLDADAYGVRLLASELGELLVTHSCCKNFGIYAERTGCLLALAADDDAKTRVRGRIAAIARSL
ncbi:MAG TPA: aminotransferase class I/II-fold pyridoxal phosphate-dependent enzyme, partial [Salinisphaeraceae bacterium]|nr:aminotransferase class I/II-fold pyridoxal phosphate-dependent enzyme [Salinisphaeraceae bacterium]